MSEEFNNFLSQLKETNVTLDFFCDFDKIKDNVDSISIKLNQLNYLIGKEDLDRAIHQLWNENSSAFSVLEILIAVRDGRKVVMSDGNIKLINTLFNNVEGVIEFIHETGLDNVFKNQHVNNLVDYVFGIETGLDTNARKNRSGKLMENQVASILDNAGISYRREVYSTEYPELSILGKDKKRFDFIIETSSCKYLIEVNFYSGGGSKLNEVARSYSELAPKINALDGFEFVWITDGIGWVSAKSKLEEAFNIIPSIYNLTNIEDFIEIIRTEM